MDGENIGTLRRQNDRYLKDIFEQNFADFLRFVFPDADTKFDLSREIAFMDKELPLPGSKRGDPAGNRVADLLAKVQTPAGAEKWIVVHTEIEGGNSASLPFRLFDYWFRISLRHERKRDVETVVFFTGGKGQRKPSVFEAGTETTNVRFRYQTCDIHGFSEMELMEMENPFSIVVLACRASLLEGKMSDPELNKIRIRITKKMLQQGHGKDRTERFLHFLWNIVHTSDPEVNREYMQEIGILTEGTIDMNTIELARKYGFEDGVQQGLQQGLQKGIQKGRLEERARTILNLKKKGMSIKNISEIIGLRPEDIERL